MVSVLALTVTVFSYFIVKHPELRTQLRHLSPQLIVGLLLLYAIQVVAIGLTVLYTVRLCDVRLGIRETLLLTMYTVVINFFGPLQSGPAFRGLYLKQKHGLKLKNFTLATFVYLGLYALFSGLFLLSSVLKWWLLLVVLLVIALALWLKSSQTPLAKRLRQLHWQSLAALALATLIQVCLIAVIYYTELQAVDPGVRLSQAITYTGAANFALFVAITPGAIGFRETFLVFSRHLHHISNSVIVAANLIDRSVYIIMLLILAAIIFGTHAQDKLRTKLTKS
jgi:uncharacterized membrane protein YbhN (UPF0104 family)